MEFLGHDLIVTPAKQGWSAVIDTQISFKDKMEKFYFQRLQTDKMKLEVYTARPGDEQPAKKLASAEVPLSQLVDTSLMPLHDYNAQTGVFEQMVELVANPEMVPLRDRDPSGRTPLGLITVKMRLRKPIRDILFATMAVGEVRTATVAARIN